MSIETFWIFSVERDYFFQILALELTVYSEKSGFSTTLCLTLLLSKPTEQCLTGRNAIERACTGIGNVINVRITRLLVLTMALSISLITTL